MAPTKNSRPRYRAFFAAAALLAAACGARLVRAPLTEPAGGNLPSATQTSAVSLPPKSCDPYSEPPNLVMQPLAPLGGDLTEITRDGLRPGAYAVAIFVNGLGFALPTFVTVGINGHATATFVMPETAVGNCVQVQLLDPSTDNPVARSAAYRYVGAAYAPAPCNALPLPPLRRFRHAGSTRADATGVTYELSDWHPQAAPNGTVRLRLRYGLPADREEFDVVGKVVQDSLRIHLALPPRPSWSGKCVALSFQRPEQAPPSGETFMNYP